MILATRRTPAHSGLDSSRRPLTQGCAPGYRMAAFQGNVRKFRHRSAFTLFEVILAIALSVALLALIGTAINLYLLQIDASRTRVEEAQLARSVLAMITDDLRNTSIYQPQDMSGIANLMNATSKFDVDSLDKNNPKSGGGGGGSTNGKSAGQTTGGSAFGSGGTGKKTSGGGSSAGASAGGGSMGGMSSMGGASFAGGTQGMQTENDLTLPLGITGTTEDLYVDVERSPRLDELFLTTTGYTNTQPLPTPVGATAPTPPRPNAVKTVRYFIRQGNTPPAGSAAVTSLGGEAQADIGGLVRQEIARPTFVMAQQAGDQSVLDGGQTLIAPEVAHIEFRYFDSTLGQIVDFWDMKEKKMLPPAIEVRIWIRPADADSSIGNPNDLTNILANAHEYRQIVYIPGSAIASSSMTGMSGAEAGTSSSPSSDGTSTSGGTSASGTGSTFDE
jgi:hypothetical protein